VSLVDPVVTSSDPVVTSSDPVVTMELKVWVEGIQRIVCGVTEKTTCQDIVYALAHATGKTGRFTLIERWRNNERLLAPQEHPLLVIKKWGEYSYDVQFILQRSPLDPHKGGPTTSSSSLKGGSTTPNPMKGPGEGMGAIWKSPPGVAGRLKPDTARLSPDSGQGSDPTGSDSSNFSSDIEKSKSLARPSHLLPPSGYIPPGWGRSRFKSPSPDRPTEYGYTRGGAVPPAYRPPPHVRNPSPNAPPPYRDPPAPPGSHSRGGPVPTSPTQGRHVSASPSRGLPPPHPHSPTPPRSGQYFSRAPHYSPPPQHRDMGRGYKGASPARSPASRVQMSPSRGHQASPSRGPGASPSRGHSDPPHQPWNNENYSDLQSLVSAQKSKLQSQHAEIIHCENEMRYFGSSGVDYLPNQLEAVMVEVMRLEEASNMNEAELENYIAEPDSHIRVEVDHLKQRLEGTDLELQKTNATLRRLGDEMRSYSQEKSKERESEIIRDISRIEQEIKQLQKSSEDSNVISDKLNREQKEVENELSSRKAEVEKLMKEMKSLNLESLTISPPEESNPFIEGPLKPGSSRKMLGSPRQLENAVPTSKNPHGVWV